jgi:Dolichyl-phosphate-mannose-protein mannosyltransferase
MRRGTAVGAVLAVAAAALMVWLQPARASWWTFADPDGAYVGSSLNILLGNHTNYLDHPGLPTQDALALAFGTEYIARRVTGDEQGRQAFAESKMLDLDDARWLYRGWAVALFLGASLLVFVVVARLLGHWTWGVGASVVFVAAPGLGAVSFLLRPDAAMSALCLASGYFLVTGFMERSTIRYAASSALLGLAMTMKLSAVGMAVPLVVAAAWRPPEREPFRTTFTPIAAWARRNVLWLVPVAFAWLVVCWIFNRERLPIVQTDDQRDILVTGATIVVGYTAFAYLSERFRIPWADRIFRLAYAWVLVAFVAGLFLPASLVLDDGVQMLVAMKDSLTGGRVNEGIEPFENFTLDSLRAWPLNAMVVVVALGLAGGVLGVLRREYWPFLLALGSVVLALMAAARYSYDYYYAPAFTVAIPGALWLFRRSGRAAAPVYVLAATVAFYGYALTEVQTWQPPQDEAVDASAQQLADELLGPGEVILVGHYYTPIEDVRFGSLVDGFVDHVPEYPYRFLSSLGIAGERQLTPKYVVGGAELPEAGQTAAIQLDGQPFTVEGLARTWGAANELRVARIVEAPPLQS